jgi:hypothetical protein
VASYAAIALLASAESAAAQNIRREDAQKMSLITGLAAKAVVSSRGGFAVAIAKPGVRNADGVVEGVELHGETLDAGAAQLLGFSSMTSQLDVDCPRRRDRVISMVTFAEPALQGARQEREAPGGWIQPSPQAYLADVLRSVCGLRPNTVLQVASLDDAPMSTSERTARPVLRPSIGLTPATPAPAEPPKPQAPARKPGKVVAQVAAAPSEAAARAALKKVARHAPDGTANHVEQAMVDGRTFYRAQVRGFADRADAGRFCKAVIASGGDCFVR